MKRVVERLPPDWHVPCGLCHQEEARFVLGPSEACGPCARELWLSCMPKHMTVIGYNEDGFAIGAQVV